MSDAATKETPTQDAAASGNARMARAALRAFVTSAMQAPLVRIRQAVQSMRENGETDLRIVLAYVDKEQARVDSAPDANVERIVDELAAYHAAATGLPMTARDSLLALEFATRALEEAVLDHAAIASEIVTLTDTQGRVRRECGRKIQVEHLESSGIGAKPIADTPLDKLAGDHPDYVAHRELLATRTQELNDAAALLDVLRNRVQNARLYMTAYALSTFPFTQQDG